ncbi:uncharacterized protein LOC120109126 [Phoenix dactylifera]|uniref:Uncharacterized protein LOC120109126 n=1 Tax=Phoenix dactylifera TaxID=42345 RepID=A0A8B8ZZK6_PHODC|nr:uncharacterized protein LOC120109126 [Phoenix dactylifera]
MNPAEWWVHFGGSARNLKRIAIRILSQTVSSSGCERNWSTFVLIHSKQRNRLMQKRLNDLIYVHYNLRLRLKCIQEEVELKYTNPIYGSFTADDDDPLLGWLVGQQQEPELDEPGSPPQPATFIATELGSIQSNGLSAIFHALSELINRRTILVGSIFYGVFVNRIIKKILQPMDAKTGQSNLDESSYDQM